MRSKTFQYLTLPYSNMKRSNYQFRTFTVGNGSAIKYEGGKKQLVKCDLSGFVGPQAYKLVLHMTGF